MTHIYSGDGKGKTTAAVGLALRAAGAELNVMFYQFLKNGSSSEIKCLMKTDKIKVRCCESCRKFTKDMTDDEKKEVTREHNEMLSEVLRLIKSGLADMIVLDELFGAYNANMLDKKIAEQIVLTAHGSDIELVMTGRSPSEIFCKLADYHSEIKALKHPYTKGICARLGIEL